MTAVLSSSALWYLTRGAGLVSLVLLTSSVVLGILQVQRWASEGWPRMVVAGLHKNLSLLVLVFLALHIVTAIADGYVPIHWISVVIPFTSPYRPLWLGLGAIAVDLLLALIVTSLLRSRLSVGTWRFVHWAAYACWPVAFVHGLGTGSDGRVGWVQVVDVLCLTAVVVATTWRLATGWRNEPARRATASVAMGVVVVAMVGWAAAGPTKAGWARRAGTPVALLATGTTTADAGGQGVPATSGAANGLTIPVNATLAGTITQSDQSGGGARVVIDGTLTGTQDAPQDGVLHIEIDGTATNNGGLRMSSSSVTMGTADHPNQYQGTITRLHNTTLTIQVHDSAGTVASVDVEVQIDNAAGTVTGTVVASNGAPPAAPAGGDGN